MHVAPPPVEPLTVPPRLSSASAASSKLTEPLPRRGLNRELIFAASLVLLDATVFTCAYLGFLWLRSVGTTFPGASDLPCFGPVLLCLASIYAVLITTSGYSLRVDMNSARFAAEHGLACAVAFALALMLQFTVFLFDFSRSRMALGAAFLVFTPLALMFRRILGRVLRVRAETQSFLILGAGPAAVRFYRACRENGTTQMLRFIDFHQHRTGTVLDGPGSPRITCGNWDNFITLVDASVEAIIMAEPFPMFSCAPVETLVRTHFFHAPILTVEAFHERYWQKIPVAVLDPLWALRQDFRLVRDSSYRVFKRGLDIAVSLVFLVALLPMLLLCALAVQIESGKIFYCQSRIRRDRQTFTLYKFRTMRTCRGKEESDLYTRERDERITRVGYWLRKLHLDELPQLWNVLRGDMSLIGPRAEWNRCVEIYEREIPGYHFRHLVKPGITGWAQVNYPYGQSVADTMEKLAYDLYYIKNYSLLLDASIVLKTLYVILSLKGK